MLNLRKKYFFVLVIMAFFMVSCSGHDDDHSHDHSHDGPSVYYTCSMHPEIKEDEPGRCPICHMNLTPVEDDGEEDDGFSTERKTYWKCENFPDVTSQTPGPCPLDGTDMIKVDDREAPGDVIASVRLRQGQLEHFRPSFFPVSTMQMKKNSRFLGTVLEAEEKESNIPARVEGRVERVHVRSTGTYIRQGDLLLEFYSPQLISAGEEYLISRQNYESQRSENFRNLLRQSEERLRQWGVLPSQYEQWARQGSVPEIIRIYSPLSGIVRQRNAVNGRYFNEGESFFDLVDLSTVWLEIDVFETDSALVQLGQEVEIRFNAFPGEIWRSQIDFIDPVINRSSRTLKVRATIDNSDGLLRPGMVAEANIEIDLGSDKLVIPRSALIDTGRRKVVWFRTGERTYRARLIETGQEAGGYVQVLAGLKDGDEIVLEGNFLLDAQAQIFGGYEEFRGGRDD